MRNYDSSEFFRRDRHSSPPPGKITIGRGNTEIPILTVIKDCYLLWHNFLPHLPRLTRYTLGVKIDNLFVELLDITHTAKYAKRSEKLVFLDAISCKLDNLKFFITLLWDAKGIDANKYGQLSQKLTTAGKMGLMDKMVGLV